MKGCLCTESFSRQSSGCWLMSTEPGKVIDTKLSFQLNHISKLRDHEGLVPVRCYAGQCCLSERVIERQSCRTPGVMIWCANSHHGQSNLLQIKGNLTSNRYVHEVLHSKVDPFLQVIPGDIFQQENAAHMLQRLFEISVQPNPSNILDGLLILRTCRLLSTWGI